MIHLELYFAYSFLFLLFTGDYVKGEDLIVIDYTSFRLQDTSSHRFLFLNNATNFIFSITNGCSMVLRERN